MDFGGNTAKIAEMVPCGAFTGLSGENRNISDFRVNNGIFGLLGRKFFWWQKATKAPLWPSGGKKAPLLPMGAKTHHFGKKAHEPCTYNINSTVSAMEMRLHSASLRSICLNAYIPTCENRFKIRNHRLCLLFKTPKSFP